MQTLRIMTYNIHRWCGRDGRRDPQRIGAVIAAAAPDVVALQESGNGADADLRALAAELGLNLYAPCGHGLAYLSRLPLRGVAGFDLGSGGCCLGADLDCDGRRLQLFDVRLESRGRQHQLATLLGEELLGDPRRILPTLVLGDFAGGAIGSATLALMLALRRGGRPLGRATFPAHFPIFARNRAYLRGDVQIVRCQVLTAPPAREASVHLPLLLEVQLTDRRRYLPSAAELAPRQMGTATG